MPLSTLLPFLQSPLSLPLSLYLYLLFASDFLFVSRFYLSSLIREHLSPFVPFPPLLVNPYSSVSPSTVLYFFFHFLPCYPSISTLLCFPSMLNPLVYLPPTFKNSRFPQYFVSLPFICQFHSYHFRSFFFIFSYFPYFFHFDICLHLF